MDNTSLISASIMAIPPQRVHVGLTRVSSPCFRLPANKKGGDHRITRKAVVKSWIAELPQVLENDDL